MYSKWFVNVILVLPFSPSIPTHVGRAGCDDGNPEGEAAKASGGGGPDQDPTGAV